MWKLYPASFFLLDYFSMLAWNRNFRKRITICSKKWNILFQETTWIIFPFLVEQVCFFLFFINLRGRIKRDHLYLSLGCEGHLKFHWNLCFLSLVYLSSLRPGKVGLAKLFMGSFILKAAWVTFWRINYNLWFPVIVYYVASVVPRPYNHNNICLLFDRHSFKCWPTL